MGIGLIHMAWETRENASNLHKKLVDILRELFPLQIILQEETIKLDNRKSLYIDIYIPKMNLAIEADGQQHYAFNSFFHKDKWSFRRQQINDEEKEIWCEQNGITLVRFSHKEEKMLTEEYVMGKIMKKMLKEGGEEKSTTPT